jgi:hypothetical protein
MRNCTVCGRPKEPTRQKSQKCRACDSLSKTGKTTPARRVTLDLPLDVWERLDAEGRADANSRRIGEYLRDLIVARDKRHQRKANQ